MSDEDAEPTSLTSELLAEAATALEHIDLINVVPRHIDASTHDNSNPAVDLRYDVTIEYAAGPGLFSNRFGYEIVLVDEDGEPTATVNLQFQVDYDVAGEYEPSSDVAAYLTRTTGLFAAYPYARELAQNLTTRLQQDPLVLGLLPRGATAPSRYGLVKEDGDGVERSE